MKIVVKVLLILHFVWASQALRKTGLLRKFNHFKEPPIESFKSPYVEEKWITQPLDHFNRVDDRTWRMRYYENNMYLKPGGPIFIYVGGEWTITPGWIQYSHFVDMAEQLNGTLFYTEHRFYGISRPTPDTSVSSLQYLNIDQALEDLAHFIVEIKATTPELTNSGVILIGGSYSATMVAWFRKKYPHLADGAWSSSAPLLAKADFYEYKEVVSASIKLVGGQDCADKIQRAIQKIEVMVAKNDTALINEKFRLCDPLDVSNKMDVMAFLGDLGDSWSGIVQYHRNQDIQNTCNFFSNNPDEVLAYAELFTRYLWVDECVDYKYDSVVEFFSHTEWNHGANAASRQWLFQTCSEYGWYQTSNSNNQLFGSGFPVEFYTQMCHDLFDGVFNQTTVEENVRRTNIRFGGMKPQFSKVFSTHGQLDPWRAMGIQYDLNSQSPTIVLPMTSHVGDLYSASWNDSPEMRLVKETIFELVKIWLNLRKV